MTDFFKGVFGYRNRKLERMLSNDPTSNIKDFRNHYKVYKPVIDQIQKFNKKDFIDIKETAEFAKKDLYNLVVNYIEPCSPEERDQFINENFGAPPLRPIPPTKHELVDTIRLLDHLGVTPHESLSSLRYYFDSPREDCIIDDIVVIISDLMIGKVNVKIIHANWLVLFGGRMLTPGKLSYCMMILYNIVIKETNQS